MHPCPPAMAAASRAPLARRSLLLLRYKALPLSSPSSSSSSTHSLLPRPPALWPPPPPPPPHGCERRRAFHDGRPRGPLWRSKKLIGKEALFAIQGLKRFKGDEERLGEFVRRYVARLLKADKLAVLGELERQEEVDLAVKVRLPPLFFSAPLSLRLIAFSRYAPICLRGGDGLCCVKRVGCAILACKKWNHVGAHGNWAVCLIFA